MDKLPVVAIVGRQNVGKSSLLNAIASKRLSIVDAMPGVTRDRVETVVSHRGTAFTLIDTGGIGLSKGDPFHDQVEKQIQFAIEQADLILFTTDVQEGLTPLDRDVAERLRGRKALLVANKADTPQMEQGLGELFALGFGDPIPVSAAHRRRIGELLEKLVENLPRAAPPPEGIKIAVIGKRNVGKSTFINALAGEERVIVSEVPGTTRDAVDVHVSARGKRFVLIDTAGLRKKGKLENAVELFSRVRTQEAVHRADAIIFMIDVIEKVTEVDKRMAALVEEAKRPCVIALNKWDLVPGKEFHPGEFVDYLNKALPGLGYAPVAVLSAKKGERIWGVIEVAEEVVAQSSVRIPTPELNRALDAAQRMRTPSGRRGRLAKIYYAAQKGVRPPRFVVFCNDPKAFAPDYVRYLENKMRELLPFNEVPIRLELRARSRKGPQRR